MQRRRKGQQMGLSVAVQEISGGDEERPSSLDDAVVEKTNYRWIWSIGDGTGQLNCQLCRLSSCFEGALSMGNGEWRRNVVMASNCKCNIDALMCGCLFRDSVIPIPIPAFLPSVCRMSNQERVECRD